MKREIISCNDLASWAISPSGRRKGFLAGLAIFGVGVAWRLLLRHPGHAHDLAVFVPFTSKLDAVGASARAKSPLAKNK